MKQNLLLTVTACLLLPAAAVLAASHVPLKAMTTAGKTIDMGAVPGWRVVYFWSTDCPCVRDCERLSLVPLAHKYKGQVTFFAVASNATDLAADRTGLISNIGLHHLPYPVLLDPHHAVADALEAKVTPQAFLIAPDGHVVFQGAPDDSWEYKARTGQPGLTQRYLADALTAALAGKPVARPFVKSFGCGIARD